MNKEEYLRIIKKGIKKVDAKEKEDILNEYESHFISGYK
ncbi:HAAS signaling domain-containing protein, partial [Staphylococcus epidermidis]